MFYSSSNMTLYNVRLSDNDSQQKQSHKLKSHFKVPWHTLKLFNIACVKVWERLKISNSWVFNFTSLHNCRVSWVLNLVIDKPFFCFGFVNFSKSIIFAAILKYYRSRKKW